MKKLIVSVLVSLFPVVALAEGSAVPSTNETAPVAPAPAPETKPEAAKPVSKEEGKLKKVKKVKGAKEELESEREAPEQTGESK